MNFLVDAHLPRRLSRRLAALGHNAIHTLDLSDGNRTTDTVINQISLSEQRIVITKDADFVESLIVQRVPYKLLLVSTGNIDNNALEELIERNLQLIVQSLTTHTFVELDRVALRIHF